jgi:hypothetical protein
LEFKVEDEDVRWLIFQIIKSGKKILSAEYDMAYFEGDDLFAINRPRGLPIGNLTSQFWANCYLNSFDHFVKREFRCKGFLRYVDDFLLFSDDKEELWTWKKRIISRLSEIRLTLHEGANPFPVVEGIPFLGFIVFPEKRRLKRRKGIYFQRRLKKKIRDYQNGVLEYDALNASVQGWVNHVRYGNTVGLQQAVLKNVKG